jgi:MFS family permease
VPGALSGGRPLGALFFGQLTDLFGRKKLFLWTLGLYLLATAATGGRSTPGISSPPASSPGRDRRRVRGDQLGH